MTRDDIIRMANEAGLCQSVWIDEAGDDTVESVIYFAQRVAAAEREAVLDTVYGYAKSLSWDEDFQADIRARGQQ